MFKLIDDLFTAFSYFILSAIMFVLIAVGFATYPIITSVLVGCYVVSFIAPWLEKLPKPKQVNDLPKWLEPKTPSLKQAQQKLWQAFKTGYNNALKPTK